MLGQSVTACGFVRSQSTARHQTRAAEARPPDCPDALLTLAGEPAPGQRTERVQSDQADPGAGLMLAGRTRSVASCAADITAAAAKQAPAAGGQTTSSTRPATANSVLRFDQAFDNPAGPGCSISGANGIVVEHPNHAVGEAGQSVPAPVAIYRRCLAQRVVAPADRGIPLLPGLFEPIRQLQQPILQRRIGGPAQPGIAQPSISCPRSAISRGWVESNAAA